MNAMLPAQTSPASEISAQGLRTGPLLCAPEAVRTVFIVTIMAACAPLLAGILFFGWRAAVIAAVCVCSCIFIEKLYYLVTRMPALTGRTHACLTGVLLALTMPPTAPWYVALVASAFAVIVGKAVFGGVGHFLWQPALVGRLAAAVLFAGTMNPECWPVLAQDQLLWGDVRQGAHVPDGHPWRGQPAPDGADAFMVRRPDVVLKDLGPSNPQYSGIAYLPSPQKVPHAAGTALAKMPAMSDMLLGAVPGNFGETSAIMIVIAGLYLIYRNYLKWQLPVAMLVSAGVVAAAAPVFLLGADDTVITLWWPMLHEEGEVVLIYIMYRILSGGIVLSAFFLAGEMTSRPIGTTGQILFGIGAGSIAMLLQMYVATPIPAYLAVLAMNTFTPLLDRTWRPRVLGESRLDWILRR